MNDHTFTLRFLSPGWSADDLSIQIYERIEDASLMGPDGDGSFLLEFDRRASSLPRAVTSALHELLNVLPEAIVLRNRGRRSGHDGEHRQALRTYGRERPSARERQTRTGRLSPGRRAPRRSA